MNLPFETQVIERYQKYIDLLLNDNAKFFDPSTLNEIKGFSAKEKVSFIMIFIYLLNISDIFFRLAIVGKGKIKPLNNN